MTRLVLLAALLASCARPAAPPPSNTGGGAGGGDFDERQACSADGDCAAVEIECCDHCNGGFVVGVHRDHADEVRRTYAPPEECAGVACTEMACLEQPVAYCARGVCGLRVGSSETTPALPPP